MAIKGITFPNQKITPSDDGVLYRALLEDCILFGCGMSTAGTTLAVGAGVVCSCGRLMYCDVSSYNLNQAGSGYARVILRIDLTGTSTSQEFSQAETEIQYAPSQGSFNSLVQENVNWDGTVYEVVLALCALSAAGITEIVSRLPTATIRGTGKPEGLASLDGEGKVRPQQTSSRVFLLNTSSRLFPNTAGCLVMSNTSADVVYTIPPRTSSGWHTGDELEVLRMNSGQVRIEPESGVQIVSIRNSGAVSIADRFGVCALKMIFPDIWLASGGIV